MNDMDIDIVKRLASENRSDAEGGPLLTLLAPMKQAGDQVQQNPIHWKNVIKQAEEQLAGCDEGQLNAADYLAAAQQKLDDPDFWQHQLAGLVYCSDGQQSEFFRLQHSVDANSFVGKNFLVSPIVAATSALPACYILACSANRVRLLKFASDEVEELNVDQLPDDLRDALNIDEYVSALQQHSTSRAGDNKSAVAFHGHGGSDPDVKKKDEILQYFHVLDRAVAAFLQNEHAPLVFVGVEYLFPIYQQANGYRNLHNEPVAGNPDELSLDQLRDRVRPILTDMVRQQADSFRDVYAEKQHTDWASCDRDEVCKAAELGQVEMLLVSTHSDLVEVNHCVAATLQFGGQFVMVDKLANGEGEADDEFQVAAVYRTPAGSFLDSVTATDDSRRSG